MQKTQFLIFEIFDNKFNKLSEKGEEFLCYETDNQIEKTSRRISQQNVGIMSHKEPVFSLPQTITFDQIITDMQHVA